MMKYLFKRLNTLLRFILYYLFQIGIFIALFAIIFGAIIYFRPCWFGITTSEKGDFIGGIVGSLLSFAGILLLVRAINDQQQSIKISQKGLVTQAKELQATRKIHQEQQFGSIFFQLLGAYNELVKSFETINTLQEGVSGRKCVEYLHENFVKKCKETDDKEMVLAKYRDFAHANKLTIKQFNQSLEMVLSFLLRYDQSPNIQLQKKYAGFISAQLSYHEEFFLLLFLTEKPQFSKEELQGLEMFDFEPEPPFAPFDFLSEFNSKQP